MQGTVRLQAGTESEASGPWGGGGLLSLGLEAPPFCTMGSLARKHRCRQMEAGPFSQRSWWGKWKPEALGSLLLMSLEAPVFCAMGSLARAQREQERGEKDGWGQRQH